MNLNHEQNVKESVIGLINKIFRDPRFFRPRFLILFSAAVSLITIFYNSVLFSCELALFQNGFLVYITTLILLATSKLLDRSERIKLGVPLAAILGTLYASITLSISNIQYYFFGFRERAFLAKGLITPQITIRILEAELGSQIYILLILVLISAFAGFLASITRHKKLSE
ncbi:MAG: hypothetical protein HOP27_05715 [Anaerolineales bacterium]|nr:hypothetical protein [Anaerolineales bacterium]